jgi:hypothetical protein
LCIATIGSATPRPGPITADVLLPTREHMAARQVVGRVLGVVAGQAQQRALSMP